MTGVISDYPDWGDDKEPKGAPAPIPANDASRISVTPAPEPTVQSEQPVTPTDPVTGAPVMPTASQSPPIPQVPTKVAQVSTPAQPLSVPGSSVEIQEKPDRQWTSQEFDDALSEAMRRGGEDADALLTQEADELARSFGLDLEDVLSAVER